MSLRRLLISAAIFVSLLVGILLYPLPASGEQSQHPINSLPVAETNIERLTSKQYLYLLATDSTTVAKKIDKIATCESSWEMVHNSVSTAYGYCQFLDSTWETTLLRMGYGDELVDELRTNRFMAVDACVWLYEHDGIRHWLESQSCHKIYK